MKLEAAESMARQLMDQYGLRDWKFKFDNAKCRFGVCRRRSKVVGLSCYLTILNGEEQVRDTVLHEIAHALCPAGEHHGPLWQSVAKLIGCSSERCYSSDVVRPLGRWTATCRTCGRKTNQHKRPKHRRSCGTCSPGVWNPAFELVWAAPSTDEVLEVYKRAAAS
jgi:predicted SprT family Zn-dependent metalloprotease